MPGERNFGEDVLRIAKEAGVSQTSAVRGAGIRDRVQRRKPPAVQFDCCKRFAREGEKLFNVGSSMNVVLFCEEHAKAEEVT